MSSLSPVNDRDDRCEVVWAEACADVARKSFLKGWSALEPQKWQLSRCTRMYIHMWGSQPLSDRCPSDVGPEPTEHDVDDVGNLCSIRCHRCRRCRQTMLRCSALMPRFTLRLWCLALPSWCWHSMSRLCSGRQCLLWHQWWCRILMSWCADRMSRLHSDTWWCRLRLWWWCRIHLSWFRHRLSWLYPSSWCRLCYRWCCRGLMFWCSSCRCWLYSERQKWLYGRWYCFSCSDDVVVVVKICVAVGYDVGGWDDVDLFSLAVFRMLM